MLVVMLTVVPTEVALPTVAVQVGSVKSETVSPLATPFRRIVGVFTVPDEVVGFTKVIEVAVTGAGPRYS